MKQTAIEWLVEKIKNEDHHTEGELGNACIDVNTLLILLEQAKKLEKQQIIDAVDYGCSNWGSDKDSEDYYNETFKEAK